MEHCMTKQPDWTEFDALWRDFPRNEKENARGLDNLVKEWISQNHLPKSTVKKVVERIIKTPHNELRELVADVHNAALDDLLKKLDL